MVDSKWMSIELQSVMVGGEIFVKIYDLARVLAH